MTLGKCSVQSLFTIIDGYLIIISITSHPFLSQPSSSSVTSMHAIRSPTGLNAVVTAGTDMRIRSDRKRRNVAQKFTQYN